MNWSKIFNKIKNINPRQKENKSKVYEVEDLDINEREDYVGKLKVEKKLKKNIETIKKVLGDSFDLNIRYVKSRKLKRKIAIVYLASVADTKGIEEIIESIKLSQNLEQLERNNKKITNFIGYEVLENKDINIKDNFSDIFHNLTTGSTIILIENTSEAIMCETKGFPTRSIQEPENEIVIRGSRDGFVENIFTNMSLLRIRIRVPHLWFENIQIGSLSKSNIVMGYIKGLASEELVDEVKARLEKIDIDTVLESGYIQEFIHDEPFTLFPLIDRTERPDRVTSCLVEGKVVILTSNTPFALILPTMINHFLQAPDDYNEPFPVTSLLRILRYIAFGLSIFLPGLYVAIINFHPEFLPYPLLMRIIATREGVPFPVFIESLIMETIFEILREAGLRLPMAIGSAVSIVGGLVVGEAAINAGLVSPPMVIIVALTAIASFTTPSYAIGLSARVLRFVVLFAGAAMGLFGIQFISIIILIHLCSLRSFGQPYFQPFGPLMIQDIKDSIIRLPFWKLITRPKLIGGRDPQRERENQKPKSPENPDRNKGD